MVNLQPQKKINAGTKSMSLSQYESDNLTLHCVTYICFKIIKITYFKPSSSIHIILGFGCVDLEGNYLTAQNNLIESIVFA